MKRDRDKDAAIGWLIFWLTVVSAIALATLYLTGLSEATQPFGARVNELLRALIPNLLAVLIGGVVVYLILERFGLTNAQRMLDNLKSSLGKSPDVGTGIKQLSAKMDQLSAGLAQGGGGASGDKLPTVPYESYRQVNWAELLESSDRTVDLVAYYFDSWVNANYESLKKFFARPNTRLRMIVSDPRDASLLHHVHSLFPEYSEEQVRHKVQMTGERLLAALVDTGGNPNRLEFYYYPKPLMYSAQCFDNRTLVMSFFEMQRRLKIDSPALVTDLTRAKHLFDYWEKEWTGLVEQSERIQLSGAA